jgi:phosphoglycerol transferase MdoB-like AlkP superfamily enzyme
MFLPPSHKDTKKHKEKNKLRYYPIRYIFLLSARVLMKNVWRYLLKLFVFLLLLFFVQRVIFLLFRYSELKNISASEMMGLMLPSLQLDISAICYVLIIPFLLLCLHLFIDGNTVPKILKYYIWLIIIMTGIINISDISLYEAWNTRINQKAISYLAYPGEVIAGALSMHYLSSFIIFLLFVLIFIFLYKKFFHRPLNPEAGALKKIIFIVVVPVLLLLGIRGGVQQYPVSKSSAYFSGSSFLNQAALNGSWNFIYVLTHPVEENKNPYKFFADDEARKIVKEIFASPNDSSVSILKTKRPNILLIMLESFSADVIEPLGGLKGITPGFTELSKEGLLFTHFYASGFRTEQGLAALISGFPSQPQTTIIRQFGKFDKLPGLAKTLDSASYTSSYYAGGDLHFANTISYLRAMGFDKLYGEEDFKHSRRTGWAAYDEDLFRFVNENMRETHEPFFTVAVSETSHEPFDADVEKIIESKPGDWCNDYLNTVHYTDKCLKEFISSIKNQSWYANTLVAIVADHGHACPSHAEPNSEKKHHIPFLLLGGALKEELRGKTFSRASSQIDFPAIILSNIGLKYDQYHWSRNVFNPTESSFAFYSFDDGFGWINERQQLIFDNRTNKVILKNDSLSAEENELYLRQGKAYLQLLMDEYVSFTNLSAH